MSTLSAKILFINACPRKHSRTKILADYLLNKLKGTVLERNLTQTPLVPLTEDLLERREALVSTGNLDHPILALAKEFAAADTIVIAAPFWDLSFPSLLKTYIENINVVGLTFAYHADGKPYGLCRAKSLYYVTTAGGTISNNAYGYGYIQELAQKFYAIPHTYLIKAENLDIENADTSNILLQAKNNIDLLLKNQ